MHYISPRGSDQNSGTQSAPWATVERAVSSIKPGDIVWVAGGLYRVDRLVFGPAGSGPDGYTVFRAMPGERPVFTRADGTPPPVNVASYTQVEGLWFGGTWASNSVMVSLGGSPISQGVRLIGCTIWGYAGGLSTGSAEDLLIAGCRIVRCGWGRFDHGIYLSGGYTPGAMTQHVVIDGNLILNGQGYAIHGWHNPRSCIITRNITYGHYWGLVYGGRDASDSLIAHNVLWSPTGQPGREPATAYWIPGHRILFVNNLIGAPQASFGGPCAESRVERNAYAMLRGAPPSFDANAIVLSEQNLHKNAFRETAAAKLDALFSGSAEEIYASSEIEPLFAILRDWSDFSELAEVGVALGLPTKGKKPPIGIESAAWQLSELYETFERQGLRHYDRHGNKTTARPLGWTYALTANQGQ